MIDTSDGLLADLGHIAKASDVTIDVSTERLAIPGPLVVAAGLVSEGQSSSLTSPPVPATLQPPLGWVLTGGEDHAMAATFPADAALPADWRVIGTVRSGSGVTVDGQAHAGPSGWKHFLSQGTHRPSSPRPSLLPGASRHDHRECWRLRRERRVRNRLD
jgi:thiamine-monophosphate kinase